MGGDWSPSTLSDSAELWLEGGGADLDEIVLKGSLGQGSKAEVGKDNGKVPEGEGQRVPVTQTCVNLHDSLPE